MSQGLKKAAAQQLKTFLTWLYEVYGVAKLRAKKRRYKKSQYELQVGIFWQGLAYDYKVYRRGERAVISNDSTENGIKIPIPMDEIGLNFEGQNAVIRQASGMRELRPGEEVDIKLGAGLEIRLCYSHAESSLGPAFISLERLNFFEVSLWSTSLHAVLLLLLAAFAITGVKKIEKKLEVRRFAKLVQQVKKVKKPLPKKVVKKKPVKPKAKKKKVVKKTPAKKKIAARKPIMKRVVKKKIAKKKFIMKKSIVPKKASKKAKVAKRPTRSKAVAVRRTAPKRSRADKANMAALSALKGLGSSKALGGQAITLKKSRRMASRAAGTSDQLMGMLSSSDLDKNLQGSGGRVKTLGKSASGESYGVKSQVSGSRGVSGGVVGSPSLSDSFKEEGLTSKQVMSVVKRHLSQIQQCYEKSLLRTPGLAGRAEYEWVIRASGAVEVVRVARSDIKKGSQLNNCVKGIFKKMKFARAKNGLETMPKIGFPFGRL